MAEGESDILVRVTATIDGAEFYDACEPEGGIESEIEVTKRYRLALDRMPVDEIVLSDIDGRLLVSGDGSNALVQGQKSLDQGDLFGAAVAIHGNFLAIGAPGNDNGDIAFFGGVEVSDANRDAFLDSLNEDNSLNDSGAVYIFQQDANDNWALVQFLKPEFPDAGDEFGYRLAMSDELLVVTAFKEDSASAGVDGVQDNDLATDSGAVYVYRKSGNQFNFEAYLKAPVNSLGNEGYFKAYGHGLQIENDDIYVSAHLDDESVGRPDTGVLYNFFYDADLGWRQGTLVRSDYLSPGDQFGKAFHAKEGILMVGAPGDDTNLREIYAEARLFELTDYLSDNANLQTPDSGAAHFFAEDNGVWEQKAYLKARNADEEDAFGSAVAFYSTFFGVAIGAPGEDGGSTYFNKDLFDNSRSNSGAVYAFDWNTVSELWTSSNYIKSSDSDAGGLFGASIVEDGGALVVSAPNEGSPSSSNGAAYLLLLDSESTYFANRFYLSDALPTEQERTGAAIDITDGVIAYGAPGAELPVQDGSGNPVGTETEVGAVVVVN